MSDKPSHRSSRLPGRSGRGDRSRPARPAAWRIEELARRAGVPVRTVRYYLSRGLLPAPAFRGPRTTYGAEHLARLQAIQRLQADYLPLEAIARALEGRGVEDLERIALEGLREIPRPGAPAGPVPGLAEAMPAESSGRASAPPASGRLVRWRLAPGLELLLDEEAPAASRRLAERIRSAVAPDAAKRGEN